MLSSRSLLIQVFESSSSIRERLTGSKPSLSHFVWMHDCMSTMFHTTIVRVKIQIIIIILNMLVLGRHRIQRNIILVLFLCTSMYFVLLHIVSKSKWNYKQQSTLLKQKYKIEIPLSFTTYLHQNAIEIFIEPIFKHACLFLI